MTLVDAAGHIRDEMATFESAGITNRTSREPEPQR